MLPIFWQESCSGIDFDCGASGTYECSSRGSNGSGSCGGCCILLPWKVTIKVGWSKHNRVPSRLVTLETTAGTSVADMKEELAGKIEVPAHLQRWAYAGRVLEDNAVIGYQKCGESYFSPWYRGNSGSQVIVLMPPCSSSVAGYVCEDNYYEGQIDHYCREESGHNKDGDKVQVH